LPSSPLIEEKSNHEGANTTRVVLSSDLAAIPDLDLRAPDAGTLANQYS
jgi:hypothetical protein